VNGAVLPVTCDMVDSKSGQGKLMRHRVISNPIWTFESDKLSHHRREVMQFVDGPACFDRSIQSAAKKNATSANDTAAGFGSTASQIGSSLIPGLEREAQNPQGFTPVQKNNMLVASQEGVGGANSGITGQANLAAARTRNAGGFARALDEAARQKGRQLSSNALGVQNEDARVALQRQQDAQHQLAGLYGTNTSDQLKAMGLSDEDLRTALEAGKSGWQQNAMNWITTLTQGAKAGAQAARGGGDNS